MFASFGYLFGLFYVKQNWDFSTCSCSNWHVLYFLWATISIFGICYSFIHFSFSKVFYNKWMNYALCMVLAGLCSSSILIYPGYFVSSVPLAAVSVGLFLCTAPAGLFLCKVDTFSDLAP